VKGREQMQYHMECRRIFNGHWDRHKNGNNHRQITRKGPLTLNHKTTDGGFITEWRTKYDGVDFTEGPVFSFFEEVVSVSRERERLIRTDPFGYLKACERFGEPDWTGHTKRRGAAAAEHKDEDPNSDDDDDDGDDRDAGAADDDGNDDDDDDDDDTTSLTTALQNLETGEKSEEEEEEDALPAAAPAAAATAAAESVAEPAGRHLPSTRLSRVGAEACAKPALDASGCAGGRSQAFASAQRRAPLWRPAWHAPRPLARQSKKRNKQFHPV
jgi:hypothetical protein